MKTAEEILESHLTSMLSREEDSYVTIDEMKQVPEWEVCVKAIEQAQKEAYNQALDDAAENVEVDTYELDPMGDNGFILQKTLRLPLYTRGFNLIIVGKVELNKDSILKLKK